MMYKSKYGYQHIIIHNMKISITSQSNNIYLNNCMLFDVVQMCTAIYIYTPLKKTSLHGSHVAHLCRTKFHRLSFHCSSEVFQATVVITSLDPFNLPIFCSWTCHLGLIEKIKHSIHQSIHQSSNQPTNQPISQSINQSINQSITKNAYIHTHTAYIKLSHFFACGVCINN